MKLNDEAVLSCGRPEYVQSFIEEKFGATLPTEFLDIFCSNPESALLFRYKDHRMIEVFRKSGLAVFSKEDIGENISVMVLWPENGVLNVRIVDRY
jgi:hypothetical protein